MQERFSRSEFKVMQFSVFIVCLGIVMFFMTAKTLLIPALKSTSFEPTVCEYVGERIVSKEESQGIVNTKLANCPQLEVFDPSSCKQILVHFDFPFLHQSFHANNEDHQLNQTSMLDPHQQSDDVSTRDEGSPKLMLQQQAVLFLSDIDLLYDDKCSYHPHCSRDLDVMTLEVLLFHGRTYFLETVFDCHFDPKNPNVAVMYRTFTKSTIFHSIFWPFLLVSVGIIMFLIVYCCIGKLRQQMLEDRALQNKLNKTTEILIDDDGGEMNSAEMRRKEPFKEEV